MGHGLLTRYRIEVDTSQAEILIASGYGVTAYGYEDALALLEEHLSSLYGRPMALPVVRVIEGVDVST